ncbi:MULTISPECIES: OmpA family protein [unclassified Myroides]|uniref:OmpA family protein n=1 Tax=unclassified Myroides TaxID=2642485 RepID=UPI0031015BA9
MMNKKLLNIGLFIAFFIVNPCVFFGQIRQDRKGSKQFDNYAYSDAIETYMKIVKNGKATSQTYAKLGDAYYFNAKLPEANQWYDELFKLNDKDVIDGQYYFRYTQTLKAVGDKEKAAEIMQFWLNNYATEKQRSYYQDQRVNDYSLIEKNKQMKLSIVDFNSDFSDYGAFGTNEGVFFTSARSIGSNKKKVDRWTREPFTSLFEVGTIANGEVVAVDLEPALKLVNQSTVAISKDGHTMFFTSNSFNRKGKRRYNKKGTSLLKIFKASKLANGTWGNIKELSINSDNFNTAHPSLSPDEKLLYFSSDRPGGFGESDLYKVELKDLTPVSQVVNLGEGINTSERETFPFITDDALYFSSDSRIGFGGLDIFKVDILRNGTLGEVKNLGENFNSAFDDFAFFKLNKSTGYLSSNRPNDKFKSDNIYIYSLCITELFGQVKNEQTLEGIGESQIKIKGNGRELKLLTDASGGFYTEDLSCGEEYNLLVESVGYESKVISLKFKEESSVIKQDILLKQINNAKWEDIVIEPIYFNFDKAFIRSESIATLNKILNVLDTYKDVIIEIRSHTDSRGTQAYNLNLSNKRALETANWLISNGVDKWRIIYKGVGESELLNECKDNVQCTNEKHAINRRSEFNIIKKQ